MSESELIKKLGQRMTDLETKMGKPQKEKKPRKPSEYNLFVKNYISKNKDPKKDHKEIFADAVKAWNTKK
jgi:hypothetical protein